jgi:D-alanyl-D-alanine dipeptidase
VLRRLVPLLALLLIAAAAPAQPAAPPADALPDGFVHLRDVAPTIVQEIRYHGPYNFVGEPITGYEAPTCILTDEAARSLARVQADLAERGLGLKVYDCYRPQRAVDQFVRWAGNLNDERMKTAFYPDEPKRYLFSRGYIARRSGHSRGSTVDLTIVPLPAPDPTAYPSPDSLRDCTGDGGERFPETGLDMGTAYDCLSPRSATEHAAVGEEVLANRLLLREAMMQAGFRNYHKEWWHYSLRREPFPETYFDFSVR